jgi:hypothetical protein
MDAGCVLQSARDDRRDRGAVMLCVERREEWRDAQGNEELAEMRDGDERDEQWWQREREEEMRWEERGQFFYY